MRYLRESTLYNQELERAYESEWTVELGLNYYVNELRYGFSYQRSEQINAEAMVSSGRILESPAPEIYVNYKRIGKWLASVTVFERLAPN